MNGAAAVEFVDLGAAAESVGEDHRARRGFPQPGQQGALGAGFAHLAVAQIWTASVVIGIEPKSAPIGDVRGVLDLLRHSA